MSARHLNTDTTEARAIREGHLDLDSSASMLAALDRIRELEEWEREAPAGGGLSYVKSFPHAFGATFCLEHTDDGYSTCVWDDPELLFEAVYDLDLHCKHPAGRRRAHVAEAVSA